eukprot:4124708-Amphidinium_carterae.1
MAQGAGPVPSELQQGMTVDDTSVGEQIGAPIESPDSTPFVVHATCRTSRCFIENKSKCRGSVEEAILALPERVCSLSWY